MKRILITLFLIVLNIHLIASNGTTFKDVSKEHWAYYSIENLINKGILEVDSDYFNGEVKTTKNDLVYYLSKVLNKLDETKADKDDLLIIENLIYEFSNELNQFGMDIESYKSKIDRLEKKLEPTENRINENENEINNIKNILEEIGKKGDNENNLKSLTYNEFQNIELRFKSEFIKNNLKDNISEEEPDEDELKYKKNHLLELKYNIKEGEIYLIKDSEESDLKIKAKGKKNLLDTLKVGFHLGDYITDISSYTGILNYNNYNINKNTFYSNNIIIESDMLKLYSEERELNNKKQVELILDLNTKYMKSYYHRNFESVLNNYELSLMYPEISNFNISLSYINEEKKDMSKINYKYVLSKLEYFDEKKEFILGYEHKIEDEAIYNNFFGKAKYELIKGSHLGYELEILDSPINSSFIYNNRIKLQNITENSNIRFEIKRIKIEKQDIDLDEEDIRKYEYTELNAKLKYNIGEKYGIKMSYLIKNMKESQDKKTITYIMPYYKINENIEIYIKYLEKNYNEYDDIEKNMDGEYYNMNFDKSNGIVKDGDMVSVGIDLKF